MSTSLPIAVHILLVVGEQVLLLKRKWTTFFDGFRSLPGWRLELGETMTAGAVRELKEEAGILIQSTDIVKHLIMQHKDIRGQRVYYFGLINDYKWKIQNMEPDKCADIKFFNLSNLPDKIIPHIKTAIQCISKNISYIEYWF